MTVQTRNVYYFSGFDPRGTAYYYRLFRTELRKSGYAVALRTAGVQPAPDPLSQQLVGVAPVDTAVAGKAPSGHTHLNLFLMKWDDIVRQHWPTSFGSLLMAGLQVYRTGLSNIPLRKVWQISHGAFWAGVLPLMLLALMLAILALAVLLVNSLVDTVLPASLSQPHFPALAISAIAVIAIGASLPRVAEKSGAFWLIRIFRFNLLLAADKLPEVNERQRAWVESIIRRQMDNPSDEVVLVGHSVGTIILTEVARQLVTDPRWQAMTGTRPTKILTLGNCIPFVSLHPDAARFRDSLRMLGDCQAIEWWDITAKVDPLCFFLSSPMGEPGQPSVAGKPALRTARFFRMYPPQQWKRMRRNKLGLHFLYLKVPDIDRDFNLYRLICGANPLDVPLQGASHG